MMKWLALALVAAPLATSFHHVTTTTTTTVATRTVLPTTRTPVMAAPAPGQLKQKQKQVLKKDAAFTQKAEKKEVKKKEKKETVTEVEEIPMFKVMLLGDDDYDQAHICAALTEIVETLNIKEAEQIYQEAQNGGEACVCVVQKEYGEAYVEQLLRRDPMIYSELQEA